MRSKVGQFDFVCVLECKDLAENVGLDVARSFAARIDDLAVSQGVLVSARGFTEDALTFLRSSGILAYTLIDAESVKWSEAAIVPAVAAFIWLQNAEVEFTDLATNRKLSFPNSTAMDAIPLIDVATGKNLTSKRYLENQWDDLCCQPISSERRECTDISRRLAIVTPTGSVMVRATLTFLPSVIYHYGYIPLLRGRGFVDTTTGAVLLGGEFETADIIFDEIRRDWPQVTNLEEVPLKRPVLTFETPVLFSQPQRPLGGVKVERRVRYQ